MENYSGGGKIPSEEPKWKSMIINSSQPPREMVLYRSELSSKAGKRTLWKPEQKKVSLMMEPMQNFTRPGDLMMVF